MKLALAPVVRLLITFAIVWFYQALTAPFVPNRWVHLLVVIVLGIPTWLVVSRYLFPAEGDAPLPDRK